MRNTTLVFLALIGCNHDGKDTSDDTDTTPADTTPELAWQDAPPVAAPQIPWLESGVPVAPPVFDCREGWTATTLDNGATICEPWPSGTQQTCDSPTAMHLPGTPGCAEVGATCPAGAWPTGLPASGVIYVAPGGMGDGSSADSPLATLAAAVAAAQPGDTIALAKGTYDGAATIDGTVTLRGACAAETILTGSALGETDAVVFVDGGTATLSDLQIADAGGMGVHADNATVTLDGVVLRGNTQYNLYQTGGTLTIDGSLATGARSRPSDDTYGYGITTIGADFTIRGSAAIGNTAVGMKLEDGTGTVDGCVVADTLPKVSDLSAGIGIAAQQDVTLDLQGVVIEGGHTTGLNCIHQAVCTGSDLVIRDIQPRVSDESFGEGLYVGGTAKLTASQVYIDHTGYSGAHAYTPDTPPEFVSLDLQDVVITHAYRADGQTDGGVALVVAGEHTVRVARALFADNGTAGVLLDVGSIGELSDLRVARSHREGGPGVGIYGSGAGLTLERAAFEDNDGAAMEWFGQRADLTDVYVSSAGLPEASRSAGLLIGDCQDIHLTRALVEDVAEVGTTVQTCEDAVFTDVITRRVTAGTSAEHGLKGYGIGINFTLNTASTLTRAQTSDTVLIGVGLSNPATVTDLRVSHVVSELEFGWLGVGVFLETDADVTGERWIVEDTRHAGIGLADAKLAVTDLLVDGVAPRPCVETTCPDDPAAAGVYANKPSRLDVTHFRITGAEGVGAWTEGVMYLTNGFIQDTPFAAGSSGRNDVVMDGVDVSGADAATPDTALVPPSLAY